MNLFDREQTFPHDLVQYDVCTCDILESAKNTIIQLAQIQYNRTQTKNQTRVIYIFP